MISSTEGQSQLTGRLLGGLLVVAPAAVALLAWQLLAVVVTVLRGVPFPTPWTTLLRLLELVGGRALLDYSIYRHLVDSLFRWAAGFAIASFCGVAFGLAAGWWRPMERITMPSVQAVQLIPGLAWIPVALLLFGVGESATVFMIAVTAFTPVAINVVSGVKRVDMTHVRAARMLGARGPTLFLRVLLPGALPQIVSGLRIGLGNGWRVLVAAEMIVGTGTGLGYSIIQSRWTLDYRSAFASILLICLIGLLVERLVFAPLERRTVERWGLPRTS